MITGSFFRLCVGLLLPTVLPVDGLLTDIPFGASSDLRHPLEYLGHDLRLLGQRQAL